MLKNLLISPDTIIGVAKIMPNPKSWADMISITATVKPLVAVRLAAEAAAPLEAATPETPLLLLRPLLITALDGVPTVRKVGRRILTASATDDKLITNPYLPCCRVCQ